MKAILMGYYGAGNLGDEMMLFCIEKWLTCPAPTDEPTQSPTFADDLEP